MILPAQLFVFLTTSFSTPQPFFSARSFFQPCLMLPQSLNPGNYAKIARMPIFGLALLTISIIWLIAITLFLVHQTKKRRSPISPLSAKLRFGLVKYSPFSDTGGEQSFTLSLLDGEGDGILFTSLHGRETTRTYVKRINKGKSDQELSSEEKKSLFQALEKNI